MEGLTCIELIGEVNHTTECVTDHLSFWEILFATQSSESCDYHNLKYIDSFHQLLFAAGLLNLAEVPVALSVDPDAMPARVVTDSCCQITIFRIL